ncbi:MAG TPA: hypothetical protein VHZ03_50565 [Trebonia sp.]|jgi:hypothetical protein|nr:hypothetical protein [Trebonia sp.]
MTDSRCACGFSPTDAETLTDHLNEMFAPSDDEDQASQLHAEATPGSCLCGHTAGSGADLDAHLLAAFTPPDHLGRDGSSHDPVGETP